MYLCKLVTVSPNVTLLTRQYTPLDGRSPLTGVCEASFIGEGPIRLRWDASKLKQLKPPPKEHCETISPSTRVERRVRCVLTLMGDLPKTQHSTVDCVATNDVYYDDIQWTLFPPTRSYHNLFADSKFIKQIKNNTIVAKLYLLSRVQSAARPLVCCYACALTVR